jgi:hypothetical protein
MNETEKEGPKDNLLQQPDVTYETTDEKINVYQQRSEEKKVLTEERGFSNIMAESFLDKLGYPRPPGWRSVFFYPDSKRPRPAVVIWLVVALGVAWFIYRLG